MSRLSSLPRCLREVHAQALVPLLPPLKVVVFLLRPQLASEVVAFCYNKISLRGWESKACPFCRKSRPLAVAPVSPLLEFRSGPFAMAPLSRSRGRPATVDITTKELESFGLQRRETNQILKTGCWGSFEGSNFMSYKGRTGEKQLYYVRPGYQDKLARRKTSHTRYYSTLRTPHRNSRNRKVCLL